MKHDDTYRRSIRFTDKIKGNVNIHPDHILMLKSMDHWVDALVAYGKETRWVSRNCSMIQILEMLNDSDFQRVNKFYILNMNHFTSTNENDKTITFDMTITIKLEHKILLSDINKIVK